MTGVAALVFVSVSNMLQIITAALIKTLSDHAFEVFHLKAVSRYLAGGHSVLFDSGSFPVEIAGETGGKQECTVTLTAL